MTAATHRVEIEYVWPRALVRPSGSMRLVYLDQKDWVHLAQAAVGHAEGFRYERALHVLRRLRASGAIVCPLSSTHVMETVGNTSARQRGDLAAVMEELSGFTCLLPRDGVMRMELEALLDSVASPRANPYAPVPLVGLGIEFAFGKSLRLRITEGERDITEEFRRRWPAGTQEFDQIAREAHVELSRRILRGPVDAAEEQRLRELGWQPRTTMDIADERAQQERDQADRFNATDLVAGDPTDWRRERVRDVVRVRHVALEMREMLFEGLAARGLDLEDVWSDPDAARRLTDAMPSSDVCISLMTEYHRNPRTIWDRNRIFDIDALSIALAYCDAVVTDRDAAAKLEIAGLPSRVGTPVFRTLDELADFLVDPGERG